MRTFTTPPFTRAPFLLRGHAAVVLAVFGTAAILGLVASATPLYISSSGYASLHQELEGRCASSVGGTLQNSQTQILDEESMRQAVGRADHIGGPVLTRIERPVELIPVARPERSLPVRFMSRTGFVSELRVLEQNSETEGVWLSDRATQYMQIGAGDEVTFDIPGGRSETVTVAGVYGDVYFEPPSGFWCTNEQYFFPVPPTGDLPVPLALVDRALFDAIFVDAGSRSYSEVWEFPLDVEGITVDGAAEAIEELSRLKNELHEANPFVFLGFSNGGLDFVVRRTRALMEVLQSSIVPIAATAILGALGLAGAAGSYWVDRRRQELVLLAAKGVSPVALAVKAVLELIAPVTAGLIMGWGVAIVAVPVFGPSSHLDGGARWAALRMVLMVGVAGLALIASIAGLRARTLIDRRPRRTARRSPRLLAGAVLAGAAVPAYLGLGDNAIAVAEGDVVGTVSPMILVFPLLLFGAVILVAAELIARLFPVFRRTGSRLAPAPYLAARRITSAPVMALVLVAASAFPVATLVYSSSLVRSVNATIDAKATGFIGSDVSVAMAGAGGPPAALSDQTTQVVRFDRVDAGGRDVDVIGVDPATVAQAIHWDVSFADRPLSELVSLLGPALPDSTLPAVVANGTVEAGSVLSSPWDDTEVVVEVVAEANAFPGMRSDRPLVIVERDALLDHLAAAGSFPAGLEQYLWVRGFSRAEVVEALNAAGIRFRFITQTQGVLDLAQFITVIRTFDFIEVIGVLAGLIATAGVMLYADTRQRARNLAYALVRRMGLSRRSHTLAGLLEIGTLLMIGLAMGVIAGSAAARMVYLRLDPIPRIPPGPLPRGAAVTIAVSVVVTAAVGWLAAWVAQRAADRSEVSEVLRHGD